MLHTSIRTPHLLDLFKSSLFPLAAPAFLTHSPSHVSGRWRSDGDRLHMSIEAPGATTDDIALTLEDRTVHLTVRRELKPPDGYEVVKRERRDLAFSRRFQLGPELDPATLSASLVDGVLTLSVAKAPEAEARTIVINTTKENA